MTNFSQNPMTPPAAEPTLSSSTTEVYKSPTAFRTISEVATSLAVPQHVLRFWESKFQQIRPLKRGGGRRYYRPEDVQLISSIKDLLYSQGFTIRGVQKLLKENGRFPSARSMVPDPQVPTSITALQAPASNQQPPRGLSNDKRREIEGVLNELRSLRELLRQSGI
jgi:DNA-binding transcriptional MerR regulator